MIKCDMRFKQTNWNFYRPFIAVYETGSINKAVDVLQIKRETIGKAIKALEKQLGIILFASSTKGMKPTSQAQDLYQKIGPLANALVTIEENLDEFNEDSEGILKIGCQEYIAKIFMDYIIKFMLKYKNIKLIINNLPKDINQSLLSSREIDLWIGTLPFPNSSDEFTIIELSKLDNIFFSSIEFAEQKSLKKILDKKDLETQPLITQLPQFGSTVRLKNSLENIKLRIEHEVASVDIIYAMIKKNLGIGYAIEKIIDFYKDKEIIKFSSPEELPRTVLGCAFKKNGGGRILQEFVNGLKTFLA